MGPVLILNRHFRPVQVAPWERALTLVFIGRAAVIDDAYRTYDFAAWIKASGRRSRGHGRFIRTATMEIAVPEVIILKFYDQVPSREIPFTRRNIYHHYGNRCGYCGKHFPPNELNLDHVIPRSRGGRTDWTNIIAACIPCNLKKGNRLPAEAGMNLIVPLSRPKLQNGRILFDRFPSQMKTSWSLFLSESENAALQTAGVGGERMSR